MHPTLEKLKERKLVQWALAYFAGAFVVVGLLDGIVGPLGLSQGVHQTLLALLVVGFPIALVSAWHHGERGNQRVTGPELVIIACLLGVGALGLQVVRARPESLGDPRPGPAYTQRRRNACRTARNPSRNRHATVWTAFSDLAGPPKIPCECARC